MDFFNGLEENANIILLEDDVIDTFVRGGCELKASLDDMAQIVGSPIGIIPFAKGEVEAALKDFGAVFCVDETAGVIGRRAFAVVKGKDVKEAEVCAEVLRKSVEVELDAKALGGTKPISLENCRFMREKYLNSYSKMESLYEKDCGSGDINYETLCTSKEGTIEERLFFEERKLLFEYGLKLQDNNLVQGTWGNLSMRVSKYCMLCTPSGISYDKLRPKDMVLVNIYTDEEIPNRCTSAGVKATSESILHTEIYRRRNDVNAIIHTHSKYASVFAAAEKDFLNGRIRVSDYALAGTHELAVNVADALGTSEGAIMAHHGMVAVGESIADAFEKTKALEAEAEYQLKFV